MPVCCPQPQALDVINPATEQPFVEVSAAGVEDVNAAIESAQRAWEGGDPRDIEFL